MAKKEKKIADFVDPNKNPQYYISQYYRDAKYQEWFDKNYPNLTIEEAVGLIPSKEKAKKSPTRVEMLFVVGALSLVAFALFFIQGPNTLLGSLIYETSEPNWDEIFPQNLVKNSIPVYLLEDAGGDCKVSADNFDSIIGHDYFVRGNDLAAQLNYDMESETLVLPCERGHNRSAPGVSSFRTPLA